MAKRPAPAKSELEIAKVVWSLGQATVRQVTEALPPDRKLDFWTVQTYLRRLAAKGYLRTRREGRSNVYRPHIRPDQVLKEVVNDLVTRVFDGQTFPVFQHLINERGLSDHELDELQRTLDELKARKWRAPS